MYRLSLLLLLLCLPILAADVSGAWTFTVQTDQGGGSPSFTFKQTGEKLTGTYSGLFGTAEIAGTVKGDDIQFSFNVKTGELQGKIEYKGKIESASKMKGEVEFTSLGKGTWTAAKK